MSGENLKSVAAIVENGPTRRMVARAGFGGPNVADLGPDSPEAKTLGDLFAAAPDMAEALGAIVSMYERGYTGPAVPENVRQAFLAGINDARAALAKAMGES